MPSPKKGTNVINPLSGRTIKVGGPTYARLPPGTRVRGTSGKMYTVTHRKSKSYDAPTFKDVQHFKKTAVEMGFTPDPDDDKAFRFRSEQLPQAHQLVRDARAYKVGADVYKIGGVGWVLVLGHYTP